MNQQTDREVAQAQSEARHYPPIGFVPKKRHEERKGYMTLKVTSPYPAREESMKPFPDSFDAGIGDADRIHVHIMTGPELVDARRKRSVLRRVLTGINQRWVTMQVLLDYATLAPAVNNTMRGDGRYYLVTRTGNLIQVRFVQLVYGESEGSIAVDMASSWHGKAVNAPPFFRSIINAAYDSMSVNLQA